MINFLHNYLPEPILFQFGFIRIYWYGFFIVFSLLAALAIVLFLAKKQKIKSDEVYDLGFYLIIFGLLGARIYAIFLDLEFYLKNPFEIIAVWHGGLAIHGAIIGGLLTLLIYTRPLPGPPPQGGREIIARGEGRKRGFFLWADLLVPAIALAQAIGRWGNYFNQEVFGKPTDLPWGIPINFSNRPLEYLNFQYFHPTFLYESLLDLLNFIILLFLILLRTHNLELKAASSKFQVMSSKLSDGTIFLIYLINYSLIRIGMEFLRIDQTPIFFGIRLPILVSGGIIILSLGFLIKRNFKIKPLT